MKYGIPVSSEVLVDPNPDALYRVHRDQAFRHGAEPLAYATFSAELRNVSDTDLSAFLHLLELELPVCCARKPLFTLGQLQVSSAAAVNLSFRDVIDALRRHVAGDWGEVDDLRRLRNEEALNGSDRLASMYSGHEGRPFYVVTSGNRWLTQVLLFNEFRQEIE